MNEEEQQRIINLHLMVAEILWDETKEPSLEELQEQNKFSRAIWNTFFFFKDTWLKLNENGKAEKKRTDIPIASVFFWLFFLILLAISGIFHFLPTQFRHADVKIAQYVMLIFCSILFFISFSTHTTRTYKNKKRIKKHFANPINRAKRQLAGHVKVFNERVRLFNKILRGENLNFKLLDIHQKHSIREALLNADRILVGEKKRLEMLEQQQEYVAELQGMMVEQKEISLTSAIIELERVDNLIADAAKQIHLDFGSLQIHGLETLEQEMLGLPGHELSSAASGQIEAPAEVNADQVQEEVVPLF